MWIDVFPDVDGIVARCSVLSPCSFRSLRRGSEVILRDDACLTEAQDVLTGVMKGLGDRVRHRSRANQDQERCKDENESPPCLCSNRNLRSHSATIKIVFDVDCLVLFARTDGVAENVADWLC